MSISPPIADLDGSLESFVRGFRPSALYIPSQPTPDRPWAFQEAFHSSRHSLRAMFPGNRGGKTTGMGVEADWWLNGGHPYQPVPVPPVQVIWVAPKYDQFEQLKPQLEDQCLARGWEWNGQKHVYRWENKSQFWVVSADIDWTHVQGINPHLVCVDEECPLPLWRELRARGFGRARTRYVVGATATKGESWMETEIYRPWFDHHAALGMDEEQAIRAQRHPSIWCWPRGGIQDNPIMSASDVASFRGLSWLNEKEAKVRNEGGFASWVGDPVFDLAGIEWLRARRREMGLAGRSGLWEIDPRGPKDPEVPWWEQKQ